MNKGLKITLITIFITLMVGCIGIDLWYLYIKQFEPEKVVSNTFEVGLQETTNGDVKYFMEVNMYEDLFEVKFNYMLDENKENFYSQGVQFYGESLGFAWGDSSVAPIYRGEDTELLLIQHEYYDKYLKRRSISGDFTYYMMFDETKSGVVSSNSLNEYSFFKIDLDGKLYAMKLKGEDTPRNSDTWVTSYTEDIGAVKFSHYDCYTYYDIDYLLNLIYDSISSVPNGTNSSYLFEFGNLFNYYEYLEDGTYSEVITYDKADLITSAVKSYYSIKVTKNAGKVQQASQSLFKSINGQSNFNTTGIESNDYFIGRTIIEANLNHFDAVSVTENDIVLKLKDDFISCYTQEKYKDKIYLSVLIDLDQLIEDGKNFLGFSLDNGFSNFTIISCQSVKTIDGELIYSEVAYVC